MPLPATKTELLEALEQAYVKLSSEFEAVSPTHERKPQIEGDISCCDLVAYQVGWARLLMGWEQTELSGNTPEMPAEGFKWNQLGALAQYFYHENSEKLLSQLRGEFSKTYKDLVTWIESLTDQELFRPQQRNWTGEKWTLVKWIQVNTIAPYRSARTKIRRWKKVNEI